MLIGLGIRVGLSGLGLGILVLTQGLSQQFLELGVNGHTDVALDDAAATAGLSQRQCLLDLDCVLNGL